MCQYLLQCETLFLQAFLIDATNQHRKLRVNVNKGGTTVGGVGREENGYKRGTEVELDEDVGVVDEERGKGDEADGGHSVRYTSALSSTDMKQLEKEGVATPELGDLSKKFMFEMMDDFASMQNGAER